MRGIEGFCDLLEFFTELSKLPRRRLFWLLGVGILVNVIIFTLAWIFLPHVE